MILKAQAHRSNHGISAMFYIIEHYGWHPNETYWTSDRNVMLEQLKGNYSVLKDALSALNMTLEDLEKEMEKDNDCI